MQAFLLRDETDGLSSMSNREVRVILSQAQCDALADQAEAAGLKFFDHCRAKLLAGLERQMLPAIIKTVEPDRLDRIEAMMIQMGQTIQSLTQKPFEQIPGIYGQEQQIAEDPNIDVDDVIGNALTHVAQQPIPEADTPQPSHAGVRHLGTRPPAPFSGRQVPRHLQGAFGS